MAHARGKKVILISQDDASGAPADIRHFEFVHYSLADHESFTRRLDNALRNVFPDRYAELYGEALAIFERFLKETGTRMPAASQAAFGQQIMRVKRSHLSMVRDEYERAAILLPRIAGVTADSEVMAQVSTWLAALASRVRAPDSGHNE